MSNLKDPFEDKIFFSKYKPEKKIGEGSFGKIYSAINIMTNEKFALKLESKSSGQNLLESEAYVLCYLKGVGIPAVKSYGFSGDHNILVMELLGKSLEDLFQECGCKFSLKTTCMLAEQMITRIEYVHNRHIIHRDIKPDNFIMGITENTQMVYLIDFGLAKKYRSSRNLQHIKFTNNKKLTGTARYASINALRGAEQSRRDDLEAIGYVLMYFLRGSLPWQGLKVDKREDRYKKIYEKKKSTTAEELCVGFPNEFIDYINYTRNMGFEQDPDYEYLKGLFKQIMNTYNFEFDQEFDWSSKTYSNSQFKKEKTNPPAQVANNFNSNPNNNNNVYINTSNAIMPTLPDIKNDKKKLTTQETEKINELGLTNSNMYIPTNANNVNEINKPNKFQVNQTNYKFIETLNNNNDRTNTVQANINTVVQLTNNDVNPKNNSKLQNSMNKSLAVNKDSNTKDSRIKSTENNLDDSKLSKKKKEKDKSKCIIL